MLIKLFVPEENEVIYQVYRCRVPGPLKNIIYFENQFCSAAHAPLSLRVGLQQATLPLFHFWSWSQVTFFVSVRDCPSPKYAKLEKWQSGRLFRVRTDRNKFCHFATFPLLVVTGVWCYFCGNNFLTDLGGTICRRL